MHRIHFTRALIVLTLIGTLAALPATAQAAPLVEDHEGDRGALSLVRSVVDWLSDRVTSVWGAGGSDWDPTGGKNTLVPPPEEPSSPEQAVDPEESTAR